MEVLSPKLDLMSSVPGSNAWEAASASAFPFPGSSKQSSESLPSGPIPSAQATAAKNLYSRPLVGSTSRFQAEPKQSIYPNQLAIKYQPRIPLSLHLNRRFKYLSKIYRFSQLAACRIGKRWFIPPIVCGISTCLWWTRSGPTSRREYRLGCEHFYTILRK